MKTLKKVQIILLATVCVLLGNMPLSAQDGRSSKSDKSSAISTYAQHPVEIPQSSRLIAYPEGIDIMVLNDYGPMNLNAGSDVAICNGESAFLSGVNNTGEIAMWITLGDGVFSDPYSLSPLYIAGEEDKIYGKVVLSLCIVTPGSIYPIKARDSMVLTLQNWCGGDSDDPKF